MAGPSDSEAAHLARRLARDVGERGRTRASVEAQCVRHTRPMDALHVEPSRAFADLVVSGEGIPRQVLQTSLAGVELPR